MLYTVEWVRQDGISGVSDCVDDEKRFFDEIRWCIKHNFEITATVKRLNKRTLLDIYNGSDIDALEYMLPFCDDENRELCERLIYLNNETGIGWGDKKYSPDEFDEYYKGKEKLLRHFGICLNDGEPYIM